jgi:GTPase SAR1 family protein
LTDTSAEKQHDDSRKSVYANTNVVLICFSLEIKDSFKNVSDKWIPEVKENCKNVPIILVGTYTELENIQVDTEGPDMKNLLINYEYYRCMLNKESESIEKIFVKAYQAVEDKRNSQIITPSELKSSVVKDLDLVLDSKVWENIIGFSYILWLLSIRILRMM